MLALTLANMIPSLIAAIGIGLAVISPHVCDGVLIKKALVGLIFGLVANGVHPSSNAKLVIVWSLAALVLFVGLRLYEAHRQHRKPIFLVF